MKLARSYTADKRVGAHCACLCSNMLPCSSSSTKFSSSSSSKFLCIGNCTFKADREGEWSGERRKEGKNVSVCSLFLPASIRHPEATQLFKHLLTLITFTLCFDSGCRSFRVSGDGRCGAQGLLCCGAGCWHRAGGHSGCPAG